MKTTRYLKTLADKGDADALFRLGYRLAFGRKRPRPTQWQNVFPLWEQSAQAGNDRAMFYVGTCHEHGYGMPQDLASALYWYEKAA